jgi:hypothetical protein
MFGEAWLSDNSHEITTVAVQRKRIFSLMLQV